MGWYSTWDSFNDFWLHSGLSHSWSTSVMPLLNMSIPLWYMLSFFALSFTLEEATEDCMHFKALPMGAFQLNENLRFPEHSMAFLWIINPTNWQSLPSFCHRESWVAVSSNGKVNRRGQWGNQMAYFEMLNETFEQETLFGEFGEGSIVLVSSLKFHRQACPAKCRCELCTSWKKTKRKQKIQGTTVFVIILRRKCLLAINLLLAEWISLKE